MNYFLGFIPEGSTSIKVKDVLVDLNPIFEGFDIPVRWADPSNSYIYMISFGSNLSFYKKLLLKYRLKNFKFKPFKIVFNTVKLGISRKYKELIYLDLKEGGEEMRDMLLDLRKVLNLKDQGNFLPHMVLGRVSKDLSDQEYSNLSRDISRVARGLKISNIQFEVTDLIFGKSFESNLEILLKLHCTR